MMTLSNTVDHVWVNTIMGPVVLYQEWETVYRLLKHAGKTGLTIQSKPAHYYYYGFPCCGDKQMDSRGLMIPLAIVKVL